MPAHLVVTRPFAAFKRGDAITDPAAIEAVLAGDHADHVVRVNAPEVKE